MTWLWSKLTGWFAGAGALVALGFGLWLKGRQEGKAAMRAEQDQKRAEARQAKKESDDEVDGLGHADLDERFNRWVRGSERR